MTYQLELFQRAARFAKSCALRSNRQSVSYEDLLRATVEMSHRLLEGRSELDGERVGSLVLPGLGYVATQWATWMAGGIAVPIAVSHPVQELRYVLQDAGISTLVVDDALCSTGQEAADGLGIRLLPVGTQEGFPKTTPVANSSDALILYTSGTTGRPKGVVMTHSNLRAQVTSLVDAWGWSAEDRILNVLPLHHTHGIVNVMMCALWSGACCEFLAPFDAERVWQRLRSQELTLFMAVPTIYSRLIRYWEAQDSAEQKSLSRGMKGLRLMVSGSAALPMPVLQKWRQISGHTLLERYGMTEIGMALSNPLEGERRAGTVGCPLPGIEVRLVDDDGNPIESSQQSGQIEVRGPTLFRTYWERPQETRSAFRGEWFQTGDLAQREDNGYYRILGRNSVDIIKTGGYKVSALEIEAALLTHPAIQECAVVGLEDPEWGERVCAAVVCRAGADLQLGELRDWAKKKLAVYKVPSRLDLCTELPRNAMGKVTKPQVRELFLRQSKDSQE